VRDAVIRFTYPYLAPSIPLGGGGRPDEPEGDGGAGAD
jgi:hypothetical protein